MSWENWAEFDINLLDRGDVVKDLNYQAMMAGKDLQDKNKPFNKKRKVVLELTFETDEERREVDISATVKHKFPDDNPHVDRVVLENGTGRPFHNLLGQQELPMGFDPVTGEVVDHVFQKGESK